MNIETWHYAEALLLKAARTHGIQVRKDEVRRQLRDEQHGAALAEWAETYLTTDNLLTADESTLYSILDESGRVDELTAQHDLADVQVVTEEHVKFAVEELKRSTEAINKQTEALRQQHDSFSSLVKQSDENEARRRDLDLARERNAETERTRVAAEVEAASQSLTFRISDLEEQAAQASSGFTSVLDDIFRSDDAMLFSLQKLGWELDQPDPDEANKMNKLRDICARLSKLTVDTVRTRLDTVYMDALAAADSTGRIRAATEEEIKALETEIETLYSEILPVAQMSVEQQHLEPAVKSVTTLSGQSTLRTSTALQYIEQCLDCLLSRLQRLQSRMDTHLSHQAASTSLITTARSAMAEDVPPPLKKPAAIPFPASPPPRALPSPATRMRSDTGGSTRRRRSSVASAVEEPTPLEALMQALSLPTSILEEEGARDKVLAVSRAVEDRASRCDDVARGAQEAFEGTAAAVVEDTRRAVEMVRESVLAESPYNLARLMDPEIRGSLAVLSQEVEKAKTQLDSVENMRADGKSQKRDDFIQRWAR